MRIFLLIPAIKLAFCQDFVFTDDFVPTVENEDGYKFHYANFGLDWGHGVEGLAEEDNYCGIEGTNSPINLMEPIGSYGWAYGLPLSKDNDETEIRYSNILTPTSVKFDYSSLRVNLEDNTGDFFNSNYAKEIYNATTTKFYPTHFKFRSPSEHTINGKHQDLEMQVFHKADSFDENSKIKYAGVSLMFSVEDFDDVDDTKNATF